jgi:hypothetical protein
VSRSFKTVMPFAKNLPRRTAVAVWEWRTVPACRHVRETRSGDLAPGNSKRLNEFAPRLFGEANRRQLAGTWMPLDNRIANSYDRTSCELARVSPPLRLARSQQERVAAPCAPG